MYVGRMNKGCKFGPYSVMGLNLSKQQQRLAKADTRFSMIQQPLAFAQTYHLQGINIDFENVRTTDKANLVQFVRELTPALHEQGLVVSIDVTPKSNSELWSLFLDRSALGRTVDYMMVMAYDEHWASSRKRVLLHRLAGRKMLLSALSKRMASQQIRL